jgi:hypothetical protein
MRSNYRRITHKAREKLVKPKNALGAPGEGLMRRLLKYGVILLLVAIVPVLLYMWYANWRGERMLNDAVARLDAEAAPWRWDDLVAARPSDPEMARGPELIVKVARAAGGRLVALTDLPEQPQVALTPEQFTKLQEWIQQLEATLQEARQLVQLPLGRLDMHVGGDQVTPNYDLVQKVREYAGLMQADATYQAQLGDLDKALQANEANWRAARTLEAELSLIGHLVRIAIEAITLGSLERTLAQGQPSPEALARVQKAIMDADLIKSFRTGLAGERAHVDRLCKAVAAGQTSFNKILGGSVTGGSAGSADVFAGAYLRLSMNEAHAWILKYLTDASQAFDLPAPERARRLEELDKQMLHAPPLARMFGPMLQKCHHAFNRSHAKQQCAIAALAVERFRRDTGAWPKSLEPLAPKYLDKLPEDPWTGKPLQLRPTGNGVVVYSVGPEGNLRGTFRDDAKASITHSYEFRLWNVPQRRQLVAQ